MGEVFSAMPPAGQTWVEQLDEILEKNMSKPLKSASSLAVNHVASVTLKKRDQVALIGP